MRSPRLASLRPCEAGPRRLRRPSIALVQGAVEPIEGELAGEMIGFVGVAYPTFIPDLATRPELGWRLSSTSWGRGFATEAALAARDDAFTRLALPELISIVHPDNLRSRRVAAKAGMAVERQIWNATINREVDVWQLPASGRGRQS